MALVNLPSTDMDSSPVASQNRQKYNYSTIKTQKKLDRFLVMKNQNSETLI
jgi:hypothetical protein